MNIVLYITLFVFSSVCIYIYFIYKRNDNSNQTVTSDNKEIILSRIELHRILNEPIPNWVVPKSKAVHLINEAERYMTKGLFPEYFKSIIIGLKAEIDLNIDTPKDKLAKIYFLPNYYLYIHGNNYKTMHSHNGIFCGIYAKQALESEELQFLMDEFLNLDNLIEYEDDLLYLAKRNMYWYNTSKNGTYELCCHQYTNYYHKIYISLINSKFKRAQSLEDIKSVMHLIDNDDSFIEILTNQCKRLGLDLQQM